MLHLAPNASQRTSGLAHHRDYDQKAVEYLSRQPSEACALSPATSTPFPNIFAAVLQIIKVLNEAGLKPFAAEGSGTCYLAVAPKTSM